MATVEIVQTHKATVTQTDAYDVPDDLLEALKAMPDDGYREQFVLDNGRALESDTEIDEIHETINVRVTW